MTTTGRTSVPKWARQFFDNPKVEVITGTLTERVFKKRPGTQIKYFGSGEKLVLIRTTGPVIVEGLSNLRLLSKDGKPLNADEPISTEFVLLRQDFSFPASVKIVPVGNSATLHAEFLGY